jgi:hypothetical protein
VQPAPVKKPDVVETPKTPEPVKESKEDKAMKELEDKLTVLKERGNTHFKKAAYKDAIKQFSEAINMHEAAGSPLSNPDLKLKVT